MPGMQGMIITLAIVFLIGIIIGFYLRQAKINELTEGLKRSQKRQEELEVEHQQRLQAATQRLQQDYEEQLAERIETYQAQYQARVEQLESDHQAQSTLLVSMTAAERSPTPDLGIGSNPAVEQHLRRQYETRLREAAAKLQRAYEQHLRQKLAEARQAYDRDYEKRLTAALARHHDQLMERPQELDPDVANRLLLMQAGASVPATAGPDADQAARWRQEIEASVRADYEIRLAEKIEQYQDELSRRTEELQQEMEHRSRFLIQAPLGPSHGTAEESNLNLEDLINAAIDNAAAETAPSSAPLDPLLGEVSPEDEATAELLSSLEQLQDLNP